MNQRRQTSVLAILAATAIATIVLFASSSDDSFDVADFDPRVLRLATPSQHESNYCSEAGSLNQIALDMINTSSPPGSPSYLKLKNILQSNQQFYVSLPSFEAIFSSIEEGLTRMLEGGGLQRVAQPGEQDAQIILVEGIMQETTCPIGACLNRPRIYIQTEQLGAKKLEWNMPKLTLCHASPNCVILEFSDHNYSVYGATISNGPEGNDTPIKDSTVLMPVMTQGPSRLSKFEPPTPHQLTKQERYIDIIFFGGITPRRRQFRNQFRQTTRKLESKGKIYVNHMLTVMSPESQADFYAHAKVCLVLHSQNETSGGEYHRFSEFGPYGCIPVMETFSDSIGIEAYEECGGAVFAPFDSLFGVALSVAKSVNEGTYEGRTSQEMVDWWRAGIQWESLLESVYDDAPFYSSN